ncbi:MAG: hypothetical protein NWQ38_01275 [Cellulophaga sp.]|nr:hypothetical protein [Cellulophaga sp.]
MTLYEFNSLTKHLMYDVTFQKGVFLDVKIENDKRFALYALGMFFVEIEYDIEQNKIQNICSFKTGALLDKYSNLKL